MDTFKFKILPVIILVVILVLFINGFLLAYKKTPLASPSPSPSSKPVVLGNKTENETVKFDTYTNTDDGYSLSYPENWTKELKENTLFISKSSLEGSVDISIQKVANPGNLSPRQFAITDNVSGNLENLKDEVINIQGVEGYKLESENGSTIYFPLYGNILKITILYKGKEFENLKKIVNQMLSSFRLLEKSELKETTGWKTYTNKDMQISFSHPPNFIPDTTDYTSNNKILYLKKIDAPVPFYQIDVLLLYNFEKSSSERLASVEIDKYPALKNKITQEMIKVGGIDCVKVVGLPGKFQKIDIFVGIKDRQYIISLNPYDPVLFPTFYPEANTLFYQFLSTVKFL